MSLSAQQQQLRDRFFQDMQAAAIAMQPGPDPEVTLEALIEASQMLTAHLQQELTHLREEQAE
jgi:hypothetical protein